MNYLVFSEDKKGFVRCQDTLKAIPVLLFGCKQIHQHNNILAFQHCKYKLDSNKSIILYHL
jgi:hypothetical protein